MILVAVVARATNGVIGKASGLPWRLPADLAHFKALTIGKPILMGRKTFAAIGRPLPRRHNLVLTRDPAWTADGVEAVPTIEAAIRAAADAPELMVIGGAQIYALTLPRTERIELTEVHARPDGDTRLPAFDPAQWREDWREEHPLVDGRPAFAFTRLSRR